MATGAPRRGPMLDGVFPRTASGGEQPKKKWNDGRATYGDDVSKRRFRDHGTQDSPGCAESDSRGRG